MSGVCDFVFLIDGTGSMGPCMEALKDNIGVFVDELVHAQSPVTDWRGKVVCYRDHKVDGSAWFKAEPFVANDAAALRAQLASLEPRGGGDIPESLLDALYKVIKMGVVDSQATEFDPQKWRSRRAAARVIIVFTDAPYHEVMSVSEAAGGGVTDIINLCASERIILVMYAPDHPLYDELSQIDKSQHEPIPGPDFAENLEAYTRDTENFQKALRALGKSVSKSASIERL